MKNKDYKYLVDNGFDVEIKSNRDGYSVAYLTRNGERWDNERAFFRNNKKSIEYTSSVMPNAQEESHLGNALFKLRMIVQYSKKIKIEKLIDYYENFPDENKRSQFKKMMEYIKNSPVSVASASKNFKVIL